ncbi:MAG: glycosyltransferase family 2 protein [Candidatus Omnitrophota bacterium]
MIQLSKRILIYIPCYNCEQKIVQVLKEIPVEFYGQSECLVIDNQSTDKTAQVVLDEIKRSAIPLKIHLIRTNENLGYAGSQKLAYQIAVDAPSVEYILMLHGDGQYPPEQTKQFLPYIGQDYALVNGFRDKKTYPSLEETPFLTYIIIKFLSWLESLLTGLKHKEWHTGFVMYRKDFLAAVAFARFSAYRHIDGEFLMCAGILRKKTASVPIYKKYKDCDYFRGAERVKYISHVFKIILRFLSGYYHRILSEKPFPKVASTFDLLT